MTRWNGFTAGTSAIACPRPDHGPISTGAASRHHGPITGRPPAATLRTALNLKGGSDDAAPLEPRTALDQDRAS
jgi:hypothetical protein